MNAHDLSESPSEAPIPPFDSALASLIMRARFHQVAIEPEQIKHQFAGDSGLLAEPDVLRAAKHAGLKAKSVNTRFDRLDRTPLPAMAQTVDGRWRLCCTNQPECELPQTPDRFTPHALLSECPVA